MRGVGRDAESKRCGSDDQVPFLFILARSAGACIDYLYELARPGLWLVTRVRLLLLESEIKV